MALKRGKNIKELQEPEVDDRGQKLAGQLYNQFNELHAKNIFTDSKVELAFYQNMIHNLEYPPARRAVPKEAFIFKPSSSDKCDRELYLHLQGFPKDNQPTLPYHKRWTRNSTLVHEGVQKDLMYMRKYLPNAPFVIHTIDGIPQWEENIKNTYNFEYRGKQFALSGMMDGILVYKPDGKLIGFEFKTKTNSVAQVGTYKLKGVGDSHRSQAIAYSIMFGIDEFIFMYEAVAKDQWMKGAEARVDLRTFYLKVTEEMRTELKEKFYNVVTAIENKEVPKMDLNKCLFCEYKSKCEKIGGNI